MSNQSNQWSGLIALIIICATVILIVAMLTGYLQ